MNISKKIQRSLFAAAIVLAGTVRPAAADEVGRYQMVALPNHPGSFDSRVLILDTRDGHLWQWWEVPTVGGGVKGMNGSGISYLGKVVPGAATVDNPLPRKPGEPENIAPKR